MQPRQDECPAQSTTPPYGDGDALARQACPTGQALPSAALLAGRRAVTIEHEGMQYVLRATRSGKLILTK